MSTLNIDIYVDIVKLISDKDFVHFICVSKQHMLTLSRTKLLTNKYEISKIKHVIHVYSFTKCIYNLEKWDIKLIPHTLKNITFVRRFNENCKELFTFSDLTINIGKYYINYDLLKNDVTNITNKNELIMTIVTNNIYTKIMRTIRENSKLSKNYSFTFNYEHEHCMLSYIVLYNYISGITIDEFNKLEHRETFHNIPSLLKMFNDSIDMTNDYESKLYFNDFKNSTTEYLTFLQFFTAKIVSYFKHARRMI